MSNLYIKQGFTAIVAIGLAACSVAADDQAQHTDEVPRINKDKYGHLSAIYLCGEEQLQTSHTDEATLIAYKGEKLNASRTVQVLDNAFAGETFTATYKNDLIIFRGKGYDASLTINDDVISCEKLSCIPLGENH